MRPWMMVLASLKHTQMDATLLANKNNNNSASYPASGAEKMPETNNSNHTLTRLKIPTGRRQTS